jgi:hypothetical protein
MRHIYLGIIIMVVSSLPLAQVKEDKNPASEKQWQEQSSQTKNNLYSIKFVDEKIGWAVGAKGTVLHTTDGGKVWNLAKVKTTATLRDFDVVDAENICIVGDGGKGESSGPSAGHFLMPGGPPSTFIYSKDGGKSWKKEGLPTNFEIRCIRAIKSPKGKNLKYFAVTSGGRSHPDGDILTKSGSGLWKIISAKRALYDISFSDSENGFVVGCDVEEGGLQVSQDGLYHKKGKVLYTKNSGSKWESQKPNVRGWLLSVYFVDKNIGWAVGDSGTIIHTEDGGKTWDKQNSNTKVTLNSVFFISRETGWAIGDKGVILSTSDGGKTWQKIESETKVNLNRIFFLKDNLGWIAGDKGTILHYKGGAK